MISVIVPVYNADNYIDKCVESILAQTFSEFELLLIDDGSKDLSGEKCDAWAVRDARVRVIHQKNKGIAGVRNVGISLAKGQYVAWVDSDDYVDCHFLEYMYNAMKDSNADMVLCGFYTDIEGAITHEGKEYFFDAVYDRQTFLERVYTYGMYSIMCNKFLRKSSYDNITFPEGRIFEDSSVMRELAMTCDKIVVMEKPLYYYRRHTSSITKQKKSESDQLNYMRQFCAWLQKDISVYQQEQNDRLLAYASKHLCDAVILYSENLSKNGKKEGKKIYKKYVNNILTSREIVVKSKLKYFVANISFSLYRSLFKLVGVKRGYNEKE